MGASEFLGPMLSSLAYHDYLALIWHMDNEWSRTRVSHPSAPFHRAQNAFEELCSHFKQGIVEHYDEFLKANRSNKRVDLDTRLFKPVSFIPFGHPDYMAWVLVDDFDAMHHLTAGMDAPPQELTLGFCPKAEAFGTVGVDSKLVDLDVLLGLERKKDATNRRLEVAQQAPFIVFTKYKLDGFGSVGFGVPMQHAVMRAMARRVQLIRSILKARISQASIHAWIEESDLEHLCWSILDLQGAEEVGTAIRCTNYSLALALVSGIRSLTYRDILHEDNRLAAALASSPAHRALVQLYAREREIESNHGVLRHIQSNHVFRWTYTSLAVHHDALFGERSPACNGYVGALAEFKIMPGHSAHAADQLSVQCAGFAESTKDGIHAPASPTEMLLYKVGAGDMLLVYGARDPVESAPLVHVTDVLRQVADTMKRFSTRQDQRGSGRDVIDVRTDMLVPIPRLVIPDGDSPRDIVAGDVGGGHTDILSTVLPLIRDRLCSGKPNTHAVLRSKEDRSSRLSIDEVTRIPKGYGLPVQLRRVIEHLFHNFAILISDPFLFDVVIDLYDSFATFHRLITQDLWNRRSQELRASGRKCLVALDDESTSSLANFADALQNALNHRLVRAYPEGIARDMAIDYRGGLNQILFAADAVLKCGFGLFRNCLLARGKKDVEIPRDRVGGLTRINFLPGMRTKPLRLNRLTAAQELPHSWLDDTARLTVIDADVPHVFHVASYCDYLHEAAHLIYDFRKAEDNSESEHFRERKSEVFANLVSHLFLFGSDWPSFFYYHIVSYAQGQSSPTGSWEESIQQFTEHFLRLFWASDAVPCERNVAEWGAFPWIRSHDRLKETLPRFSAILERVSAFFPDAHLWAGADSPGQIYCKMQFEDTYQEMKRAMPDLWQRAKEVYQCHYEMVNNQWLTLPNDQNAIESVIKLSLQNGRPLIRTYCGAQLEKGPVIDCDKQCGMDALFLICAMLRKYIGRIVEAEGKLIHLRRKFSSDQPTGQVDYSQTTTAEWYDFQVDKGAVSLFCPVPARRRGRLRQQITMLKTLWDIASNLRARRLLEIIQHNWESPDPGVMQDDVTELAQLKNQMSGNAPK